MKLKEFLRENRIELQEHGVLFYWEFPLGKYELKVTGINTAFYRRPGSEWRTVTISEMRGFTILNAEVLRKVLSPRRVIHITTDNP